MCQSIELGETYETRDKTLVSITGYDSAKMRWTGRIVDSTHPNCMDVPERRVGRTVTFDTDGHESTCCQAQPLDLHREREDMAVHKTIADWRMLVHRWFGSVARKNRLLDQVNARAAARVHALLATPKSLRRKAKKLERDRLRAISLERKAQLAEERSVRALLETLEHKPEPVAV